MLRVRARRSATRAATEVKKGRCAVSVCVGGTEQPGADGSYTSVSTTESGAHHILSHFRHTGTAKGDVTIDLFRAVSGYWYLTNGLPALTASDLVPTSYLCKSTHRVSNVPPSVHWKCAPGSISVVPRVLVKKGNCGGATELKMKVRVKTAAATIEVNEMETSRNKAKAMDAVSKLVVAKLAKEAMVATSAKTEKNTNTKRVVRAHHKFVCVTGAASGEHLNGQYKLTKSRVGNKWLQRYSSTDGKSTLFRSGNGHWHLLRVASNTPQASKTTATTLYTKKSKKTETNVVARYRSARTCFSCGPYKKAWAIAPWVAPPATATAATRASSPASTASLRVRSGLCKAPELVEVRCYRHAKHSARSRAARLSQAARRATDNTDESVPPAGMVDVVTRMAPAWVMTRGVAGVSLSPKATLSRNEVRRACRALCPGTGFRTSMCKVGGRRVGGSLWASTQRKQREAAEALKRKYVQGGRNMRTSWKNNDHTKHQAARRPKAGQSLVCVLGTSTALDGEYVLSVKKSGTKKGKRAVYTKGNDRLFRAPSGHWYLSRVHRHVKKADGGVGPHGLGVTMALRTSRKGFQYPPLSRSEWRNVRHGKGKPVSTIQGRRPHRPFLYPGSCARARAVHLEGRGSIYQRPRSPFSIHTARKAPYATKGGKRSRGKESKGGKGRAYGVASSLYSHVSSLYERIASALVSVDAAVSMAETAQGQAVCGDGVCARKKGESIETCPEDCSHAFAFQARKTKGTAGDAGETAGAATGVVGTKGEVGEVMEATTDLSGASTHAGEASSPTTEQDANDTAAVRKSEEEQEAGDEEGSDGLSWHDPNTLYFVLIGGAAAGFALIALGVALLVFVSRMRNTDTEEAPNGEGGRQGNKGSPLRETLFFPVDQPVPVATKRVELSSKATGTELSGLVPSPEVCSAEFVQQPSDQ
jgi:hypothetical protein